MSSINYEYISYTMFSVCEGLTYPRQLFCEAAGELSLYKVRGPGFVTVTSCVAS